MKKKIDGIEFERCAGNVFADLGLPRPEDRLIKSDLTALLTKEINLRSLTQSEVGELVGLDQADVSRLLRGRVNRFSVELDCLHPMHRSMLDLSTRCLVGR
jgi:predicted XRE-type DNA-binding protein